MKKSQHSRYLLNLIFFVVLSLFLTACGGSFANYQIKETKILEPSHFTRVVVVPLVPIRNIKESEFIDGEEKLSNFVKEFFQGPTTQVITAEQVRKDMNFDPSRGTPDIKLIAAYYKADCLFICLLSNLSVQDNYFGSGVSGKFSGDFHIYIIDSLGIVSDITGHTYYENIWVWAPSFGTFIGYAMEELSPKLNKRIKK